MKAKYYIHLLVAWFHFITMEVLSTMSASCNSSLVTGPLGVEDNALTGPLPYHFDYRCHPKYARIPSPVYHAYIGSFLEVTLRKPSTITGFKIQGRPGNGQYVTQYNVSYSVNGTAWQDVKDNNGNTKTFVGNKDDWTISESTIHPHITASYIRVVPSWAYSATAFRFEILGCPIPFSGRQTCWKANYVTGVPSADLFNTTKSNLGECGKECHGQEACYGFTLYQDFGLCQGYSYTNIQIAKTGTTNGRNATLLYLKQNNCP